MCVRACVCVLNLSLSLQPASVMVTVHVSMAPCAKSVRTTRRELTAESVPMVTMALLKVAAPVQVRPHPPTVGIDTIKSEI